MSQIGRFKEEAARFYASNILLALSHLHSLNILYRDLKPENVLVSHDGYVKIADFGLSKENIKGHTDAKSICGTAEYLAPEMVNKSGHNESIDIWSIGVLMFELLAGRPPFIYKGDTNELYNDIKNLKIKWTDDFPTLAKNLLIKILINI